MEFFFLSQPRGRGENAAEVKGDMAGWPVGDSRANVVYEIIEVEKSFQKYSSGLGVGNSSVLYNRLE